MQTYRFRCPIHGFVFLENELEKAIVDHPVFQRLRRIRQLALTDYVYPGAMHTRFEHSLGVMHVATLLFDSIWRRCKPVLLENHFDDSSFQRQRQIVRLAALLHDVGHCPFSHASEDLLPNGLRHEDYSAALINSMADVFRQSNANQNNIQAAEIAGMLTGDHSSGKAVFWRPLLSSHVDVDRMDYLLRDSHHTGVSYGLFDLQQLIDKIALFPSPEAGIEIGIDEEGIQVAEALVFARYQMYTQVYFHKTRSIYNFHLVEAMKELLPRGQFPGTDSLNEFLSWDDWHVLRLLQEGKGGNHGEAILNRAHYRRVVETSDVSKEADLRAERKRIVDVQSKLIEEEIPFVEIGDTKEKSWYDISTDPDLNVRSRHDGQIRPLSYYSSIVSGLRSYSKLRLYCPQDWAEKARAMAETVDLPSVQPETEAQGDPEENNGEN